MTVVVPICKAPLFTLTSAPLIEKRAVLPVLITGIPFCTPNSTEAVVSVNLAYEPS